MDNSSIHINTVSWELETFNVQSAADWQEKASHYSQYSLPTALAQAFEIFEEYDETIMIDQLVLDLEIVSDDMDHNEKSHLAHQHDVRDQQIRRSITQINKVPVAETARKQWLEELLEYLL